MDSQFDREKTVSAYVIFDIGIRDMPRHQDFMQQVKPVLEAAGARYLERGGAHKVGEGDWQPRRIPSTANAAHPSSQP